MIAPTIQNKVAADERRRLRDYYSNHRLLQFANAKTTKGEELGFRTAIMYLAPVNLAGLGNVCGSESLGCAESCLFTAGRAAIFPPIIQARIRKTRFFYADRSRFMAQLVREIGAHIRYSEARGLTPCVRLNGTSDIQWERQATPDGENLMDTFRALQFYDYTKHFARMFRDRPRNYHLTFSRSESNEWQALEVLDKTRAKVAAVFKEKPADWYGYSIANGDLHDLTWKHAGRVIALKAKGEARKDRSGFVIHPDEDFEPALFYTGKAA